MLPAGDDEHAPARQMALEESALALFELALESLLREVTEHARLPEHRWSVLLASDGPALAELQRLRDLAARPSEALHETHCRRRLAAPASYVRLRQLHPGYPPCGR